MRGSQSRVNLPRAAAGAAVGPVPAAAARTQRGRARALKTRCTHYNTSKEPSSMMQAASETGSVLALHDARLSLVSTCPLPQLVQQSDLFPRQQRELEEAVRGRFTEWLLSSGNLRQVLDLVQLERTGLSLGGNVSVSSGVGGAANVSAADIGTE
eukprot:TRINITY_DN5416_c0_g1_i1.p1 TRINITY_DN5416_c0_g1~~TRINITY_DN5416_c0_g1_i1.p1  ORF type:complete len:155 (-),score=29.98 TRINITY_DN5416_c0_g1_i1:76-540(-)